MSTNTDRGADPRLSGKKPSDSGISFLKRYWLSLLIVGIGIIAVGKVVSESVGGQVFDQATRNAISWGVIGAIFIAGLFQSHLPLLVYLVYLPFCDALPGRFGAETTALNYVNLFTVIVTLSCIIQTLKVGQSIIVKNSANKYTTLYIALISLSFSINGFEQGIEYVLANSVYFKRWLDPMLLFFFVSCLGSTKDMRKAILVAIMLGTAMNIFIAVKDITVITNFSNERRVSGAAEQPNMLGAFVVDYSFLFLGILFMNFRKKLYWGLTIPFLLAIKTIMYTFSRGAYLAFIAAFFFISALRSRMVLYIAIGLMVFVAGNLWILPNAVQQRLMMTMVGQDIYTSGARFESSAADRVEAWKITIDLAMERPLLGYGLNMIGPYLRYRAGLSLGDIHNSYLLLLAELGALGLLTFVSTMIAGCRVGYFVYRNSDDDFLRGAALGYVAGIIGLSVNCFFGAHMIVLWEIGFFWALLAVFAREKVDIESRMQKKPAALDWYSRHKSSAAAPQGNTV